MKLINPTFAVTELSGLRAQYGLAFLRLITVARATLPPSPSGSLPALLGPDHYLQNSMARLPTFFKSRYNQEFIEGKILGRGGFGSVYLATNKLDHVMYAVKKIHVLLSRQNILLKILREVTLLARLSHPNIVSYKTAWTEPYYGQISSSTEETASSMSLEELNLDSGEVSEGTGNESLRTGQTWTKVARIEEVVGSTPPDWSSGIQRVVGRAGSPAARPRGPVGKFWLSEDGDTGGTSEEWDYDDEFSASVQFRDTDSVSDSNKDKNEGAMIVFNRTNSIDGEAPTTAALLFIQMELCDSTLRQWLDERNPTGCVDVRDNFKIFKQILLAVEYLHNKGILHRDIKPRNIFINSHLEVKLGDFGLAKEDFLPENSESSCSVPVPNTPEELRAATFMPAFPRVNTSGVGTTAYAAPEQLRSGRVDNKSDMYSLGVVLFELYTTPLTEMERVRSISSLREGEPGCLDVVRAKYPVVADLISQLTSLSPETRPGAGELLAQKFSSKDLSLLEREREQKALREQVKLQSEQILKQEQLIAEQNAELEILRGVIARLSPTKTKPPSES